MSSVVKCEMERDGFSESCSKKCFLVYNTDEWYAVFCEKCLNLNLGKLDAGTRFFAIGDETTFPHS